MASLKEIRIQERNFVNKENSPVILKGVNMVCKDQSLNHIGAYTADDFKFLKGLGINVIRLGIFWESIEPAPGIFDDNYLEKIDSVINMAKSEGICVFLDMHQDLFSSIFEDGAPKWATLTDGAEHVRTELWSESYLLSPAVQKAFDNFWGNTLLADGIGLMDHFVKAWEHVAKRYSDEPYVIGYDFFNEPFPGSSAVDILPVIGEIMEKLSAGTADEASIFNALQTIETITAPFDEKVLNPFYDKIIKAVRKYDPESIAFLENDYFGNAAVPCHVAPAKEKDQVLKNQAFAPHGYDIFVDTDHYDDPDTSRVDLIFSRHFETAARLSLPMLVGEWGCYPDASEVQLNQFKHLKALFSSFEASDTYFDFEQVKAQPKLSECMKNT